MAYGYIYRYRNKQRVPSTRYSTNLVSKLGSAADDWHDLQGASRLARHLGVAMRMITKTTMTSASIMNDSKPALMRATGYTPRMSASCTMK